MPKIDPSELFSELPFGGVFGRIKLINPNNAETPAATINVILVLLKPKNERSLFLKLKNVESIFKGTHGR